MRGLIDADGSIGRAGKGVPFISLTTSSTAIAAHLYAYAREITGVERMANRNARDEVYNIMYEKEAAQILAADLYYPGCLSLGRKQVKAEAAASWTRPYDMRIVHSRRWTACEDQMLLQSDDVVAVAEKLGRSEQSCRMRRWRLGNSRMLMPSDQ